MESLPIHHLRQVHHLARVSVPFLYRYLRIGPSSQSCSISIPVIYFAATKTGLLNADPMLWFAMMLMPTGPPAMILVALSEVNGSPESQKMAIAKFLTVRKFTQKIIHKLIRVPGKLCNHAFDFLRCRRSPESVRIGVIDFAKRASRSHGAVGRRECALQLENPSQNQPWFTKSHFDSKPYFIKRDM